MQRKKDPAAVSLGRKGGKARAAKLDEARRREIAAMGGKAKHARIIRARTA